MEIGKRYSLAVQLQCRSVSKGFFAPSAFKPRNKQTFRAVKHTDLLDVSTEHSMHSSTGGPGGLFYAFQPEGFSALPFASTHRRSSPELASTSPNVDLTQVLRARSLILQGCLLFKNIPTLSHLLRVPQDVLSYINFVVYCLRLPLLRMED